MIPLGILKAIAMVRRTYVFWKTVCRSGIKRDELTCPTAGAVKDVAAFPLRPSWLVLVLEWNFAFWIMLKKSRLLKLDCLWLRHSEVAALARPRDLPRALWQQPNRVFQRTTWGRRKLPFYIIGVCPQNWKSKGWKFNLGSTRAGKSRCLTDGGSCWCFVSFRELLICLLAKTEICLL